MDGDTIGVGKFMSKSVMVDCRYLSLALKHNLAVSMSLEQTWDISLLNWEREREREREPWGRKTNIKIKNNKKVYIAGQCTVQHSKAVRESIAGQAEHPRFIRFMRKETNIFPCLFNCLKVDCLWTSLSKNHHGKPTHKSLALPCTIPFDDWSTKIDS